MNRVTKNILIIWEATRAVVRIRPDHTFRCPVSYTPAGWHSGRGYEAGTGFRSIKGGPKSQMPYQQQTRRKKIRSSCSKDKENKSIVPRKEKYTGQGRWLCINLLKNGNNDNKCYCFISITVLKGSQKKPKTLKQLVRDRNFWLTGDDREKY